MAECGPDTKVTAAAAEPAAIELVTATRPANKHSAVAVVDQAGANTQSVSPSTLASAYADFWRLLRSASRANGQPLPQLTLSARRLQVHHHAPDHHDDDGDAENHSTPDAKMPTLQRVLTAKLQGLDPRRLLGLGGRGSPRMVQSLASASTLLLPGSLTLVLAPPGHGKTTLLRALAGRLHDATGQSSASASGLVADHSQLRWGGRTAAQLAAAGLQLPRLTALVAQSDDHYPMLTVRETFRFAMQTNLADTCALQSPELERARAGLVDAIIHTLGQTHIGYTAGEQR